jgi:sugar phosphate isomerase/epimerase
MPDPALLSINQLTTFEQWSLDQAIDGYARHGVPAIAVWREKLHEMGVAQAARKLKDAGMAVSGLCVCRVPVTTDAAVRREGLDDNRRQIDEAAAIGARCLVAVPVGMVDAAGMTIEDARARGLEAMAELLPHARGAGVVLGLEPLHPMMCATRSVLSSLEQANDWYEALGGGPELGITLDVYHVWWDPNLAREMRRAKGRIAVFHINDWLPDTSDTRVDRGMMGDGVIDIPSIRRMVEETGYTGHNEVEILSARTWWKRDPDEVVRIIKERYQTAV